MRNKRQLHDNIPEWIKDALRMLSAGRYSADWLPEILEEYDRVLESDGVGAALTWAHEELENSVGPSALARIFWILRLSYRAYQFYKFVGAAKRLRRVSLINAAGSARFS